MQASRARQHGGFTPYMLATPIRDCLIRNGVKGVLLVNVVKLSQGHNVGFASWDAQRDNGKGFESLMYNVDFAAGYIGWIGFAYQDFKTSRNDAQCRGSYQDD